MPKPVNIVYSTSLSPCDPAKSGCLIVGQLGHLKQITFSQLATKLSPNVTEEVSSHDQFNKNRFDVQMSHLTK